MSPGRYSNIYVECKKKIQDGLEKHKSFDNGHLYEMDGTAELLKNERCVKLTHLLKYQK